VCVCVRVCVYVMSLCTIAVHNTVGYRAERNTSDNIPSCPCRQSSWLRGCLVEGRADEPTDGRTDGQETTYCLYRRSEVFDR